jgi:CRISPR-associated endoribonuclease Cas6
LKKRKYIKFYNLILEFDKYDVFNIELEDKEKIDINFITKTPVFLQLEINDKKYVFHPLPKNKNINEEQLNEYIKLLKNNIRHKYNTNEDFILKLYDIKYKPLIIKEHRKDSYLFSFNIIASKELVEKIYYGGIGNNTGLGMGFVTLKNK